MPRGIEHRKRMLSVLSILERKTDEDHRLTIGQLMERLGLSTRNDRRNLQNDIAVLRDAGYPIEYKQHRAPEYYLGRRSLSTKEIKVLIDLVQGSRSIPQDMSAGIVESLLSLASEFEAKEVATKIRTRNRVKLFNDELLDNIWVLKRAIDRRRKVEFRYFHHGFRQERIYRSDDTGNELIVESPLLLTCNDGLHYVITYSDERGKELTRRVDRMTDVTELDAKRTWKPELQDFDIDERTLFNMFSGEERYVTLRAKEEAMDALMDRFGDSMEVRNITESKEDGEAVRYADITVKVALSQQFRGWLKGLEGLIEWDEGQESTS